jgi:hypothetical protein
MGVLPHAPARAVARAGRRGRDLAREAAALSRATRAASRAHRASRLAVVRRARRLRRGQGFEYEEALRFGLLDPAVTDATCAGFVSRHVNMSAQRRLNGADMPPLVGEKLVFHRYCDAIGLPTPPIHGVIDRRGAGWVSERLPDEIVVKPSAGYEGHGVRVLRSAELDALRLRAELAAEREFDTWLIQERLRNHPDLAALGGEETLHSARIVTLVRRDGGVEVLWACVKLGLSGGPVDNFGRGGHGNAVCAVAVGDGALGPALLPRADGCGVAGSPRLPGGARVEGVRLPDWEAAREMVRAAASAFVPLRTLGWDVALTPAGPVVIEANTRWGAMPAPTMRAAVARLEDEAGPSARAA